MTGYTRRHVVAGCCASLGVLSGCNRSNDGADGGGQPTDDGPTPQPETDDAAATAAEDERTTVEGDTTGSTESTDEAATPSDLDLREANVVGVEFESTGESDYRFDVSLYHDDDGEDGYADWWQVETLDGERLGRRELLHAHSTAPFTRSETVSVPTDVDCVVVRGHDRTHGYGGQVQIVGFDSGRFRMVQQGSDPRSFEGADCP